jgi:hypothetical protein
MRTLVLLVNIPVEYQKVPAEPELKTGPKSRVFIKNWKSRESFSRIGKR